MSSFFNIENGDLQVCGSISLKKGLAIEDVERSGLRFARSYPAGEGWSIRSIGPCTEGAHEIYFTLTFHHNQLERVSFAFIDQNTDPLKLQAKHREFLRSALGDPSKVEHNGLTVSHEYKWGTILATYDPRNGSSAVHVDWN